jgi:hypothetical protein
MHRLILGTMAAAVMVLGVAAAALAAPVSHQLEHGSAASGFVSVQDANYYYWNHHRYHHRDWDRDHHRWHYHD